MADASVLGIYPPHTVRVNLDGWVQDWPFECVEVLGDELVVSVLLTSGRRRVVFYPYEHALERRTIAPMWVFHGRETFYVSRGPAQAPPLN